MSEQLPTLETVIDLALRLSRAERARLVAQVASTLADEDGAPTPKHSAYGLLADLNIDLSAEDIDAARRDLWATFGDDDL